MSLFKKFFNAGDMKIHVSMFFPSKSLQNGLMFGIKDRSQTYLETL